MLKKLRIKFICINMGIVLAMLAGILGLEIISTRRNLERASTELLETAMDSLGSRERRDQMGLPEDAFQGEPPAEKTGETRQAIDAAPEAGAASDAPIIGPKPKLPGLLPYILVELSWDGSVRRVEGYQGDEADLSALLGAAEAAGTEAGVLREYGMRFLRRDADLGSRYAFADIADDQDTLRSLIRTSLAVGAVSVAVFFVISLLLARWAVKPVEAAWKQQKQFVSDASHELKTPLTVIMTNAELLQSPDWDAGAKARFAENILTMSRQMRGLVESLLELARVDGGAAETAMTELDFSALCADAVLPFEPVCFEKDLPLRTDLAPDIRLRGSESHLRQVVEILLDNAQKYADPGSEIAVTLRRSGSRAVLSVADRGAPIAEAELKRLFERFYRADKSRSRDGSYGLGLSIAQTITEAHHGRIWAESENGLNTFRVSLPALAERS